MSETYQLLTQMKLKNLKEYKTPRGFVAWSAELHSPQLGGHIVNVENSGTGGCNMYRVTKKLSPQVWFEQVYHPIEMEARAITKMSCEAFDTILSYTNEDEDVGLGLARYLANA